jgi:hypothetical protein
VARLDDDPLLGSAGYVFQTPGPAKKQKSQAIKQFVNAMPPALTEREHFLAQARKLFAKQQVQDRGRSR